LLRFIYAITLLTSCFSTYVFAQSDNTALEKTNRTATAQPAYRNARLIGFTRAAAEIQIIPEVSARCLKITADVGDALPRTGVFAHLDDTFIKLEIATNANRQKALETRTAYLKRELERSQTLNESAALSASELDQIQNQYDQAMLDLQARLTEAEVLRERLKRHRVVVQPGWRIIERNIEPGQWVGAGMSIGRAADFSKLLIPVSLTFTEYSKLREMPSVPVNLTDLDTTVPARLVKVSPGFDPQTRKIQAELEIVTLLNEMRGGLRAEINIPTEQEPNTYLINSAAISERYNTFWLKRQNGEEIEVAVLERSNGKPARIRSQEIRFGDVFVIEAGTP
jgi:multidrug efflux pump subunit AcrA (membrane-fusion protein)